MLVAHHLDFDVARLGDEFLDEQAVVAEAGLGFVLRRLDRLDELVFLVDDAQALAAAAGRRLHHHRIADLLGDLARVRIVLDLADEAGNRVDLGGLRQLLGFDLVAHRGDGLDVRADEGDADLGQRLGERLALGEKAVAGMHGLGAGVAAGLHDPVDDEIGLRRRRRADMDGLVGHLDMQRVRVGVGIDGDGLDAHLAGRLDDAAGDLAAIGDQNLLEQSFPRPASESLMRLGFRATELHP